MYVILQFMEDLLGPPPTSIDACEPLGVLGSFQKSRAAPRRQQLAQRGPLSCLNPTAFADVSSCFKLLSTYLTMK